MICQQCGQELAEGQSFCTKCGSAHGWPSTQTPSQISSQPPTAIAAPVSVPVRNKKPLIWLLVLALVAAIVVAIVLGVVIFSRQGSSESRNRRSSQSSEPMVGKWTSVSFESEDGDFEYYTSATLVVGSDRSYTFNFEGDSYTGQWEKNAKLEYDDGTIGYEMSGDMYGRYLIYYPSDILQIYLPDYGGFTFERQ